MNNIFEPIQTGTQKVFTKMFYSNYTIQFLSAESRFIPQDFRIKMDLVFEIVLFCFRREAAHCLPNPLDFLCLDGGKVMLPNWRY